MNSWLEAADAPVSCTPSPLSTSEPVASMLPLPLQCLSWRGLPAVSSDGMQTNRGKHSLLIILCYSSASHRLTRGREGYTSGLPAPVFKG